MGRVMGLNRLSAGFDGVPESSLPRTPTLLRAIRSPEIAPMSAVMEPITRGVLLRKVLNQEPDGSSSGPGGGSGSVKAEPP